MKNLMNKIRKANKGFTLVELIIVIAIIAVLSAVAAPQYIKYVEKSKESADAAFAGDIASCAKVLVAEGTTNDFTLTWSGTNVDCSIDTLDDEVDEILGVAVAAPASKKVTDVAAGYVVSATYTASTKTWAFTESIDLTNLPT